MSEELAKLDVVTILEPSDETLEFWAGDELLAAPSVIVDPKNQNFINSSTKNEKC